jgi:hypothetical protein
MTAVAVVVAVEIHLQAVQAAELMQAEMQVVLLEMPQAFLAEVEMLAALVVLKTHLARQV